MSSACVDPSSLHLKKELSALRKARLLRDPETTSSWRSPLSSRSAAASYIWNRGNGARRDLNGVDASVSFEPDCNLPLRSENNQQKVFLYNWGHRSSKSIATGATTGSGSMKNLGSGSPQDSLDDVQNGDSKNDANLDDPITVLRVRGLSRETPTRRADRKFKRGTMSSIQCTPISEQLNHPSSSLRVLSTGRSDDTEYCNSEDSQISNHKFEQGVGCTSCLASPLLSRYENWSHSSKILRSTRREDSSYSYTPASTSSYHRYGVRYTSNIGSLDGSTASFDGDEVDQLDLPRHKGCGMPCYWSKRTKRGGRGSCSPSLSDTLKRTGSSILCGGHTMHRKRSVNSKNQKTISKSVHSLPLLSNSCDGGDSSIDTDGLSTNWELNLESSSCLDGRRWTGRSQDGLQLALTADRGPDNRSLSQKYRPRSFSELVGQNIVVQSLNNAILRGRIAPFYLFHGPHGTGKTSMARVFAVALNCLSTVEAKPCGFCSKCTDIASAKSADIRLVDATNKRGINMVRHVLKDVAATHPFSWYKVFIITESHMLPSKAWSVFLKLLEEPLSHVVFIFITTDTDSLPRAVVSQCQKYLFSKVKDADIVTRLKKLSAEENMDVDLDALNLIALNSDGSLRDAEMMLDQLSLLGKRITTSLVNDLVGVVPDAKLLDLLELAMSSDTAETVKRARELMDSGIDPVALMSQLAGLIMDIIAGTYQLGNNECSGSFLSRCLTELEVERLKQALKILSEAEKQLRISSERSMWFTAALLQLGSGNSPGASYSGSKNKQSHKKTKEDAPDAVMEAMWKSSSASMLGSVSGHVCCLGDASTSMSMTEDSAMPTVGKDVTAGKRVFRCESPDKLDEIWRLCIEKCHSRTLRHLLHTYAKLVSISDVEGILIAYIAFGNEGIKSRSERFLSSITNSIEIVLRCNVEVRMGLMADGESCLDGTKVVKSPASMVVKKHLEMLGMMDGDRNADRNRSSVSSYENPWKERLKPSRKSFNDYEGMLQRPINPCSSSLLPDKTFQTTSSQIFSGEGNILENPLQRTHASAEELRLESAWLYAMEEGSPRSGSPLKPERNQVLPQDGIFCDHEMALSSKHWEDKLNHEIKSSAMNDEKCKQKDRRSSRIGHCAMSPSLLHSNSLKASVDKENMGYDSGPGCNGLLCWKTTKPSKINVKQGSRVRSDKSRRYLWFGQCGKSKTPENRIRRSNKVWS